MPQRKVLHIDMDAFYASIEQRDNPELRGRPVAVGYSGQRGVVAAASYEARKYGVRSAMPSRTALKKCPQLVFVPARFDVYREVSMQIHEIFLDYTPLVEPLSLDEAFLDVTVNHKNMRSATIIAREIKARIKEVTGLTASAGVSYNKFLAKIASDYDKPDGLFVIKPADAEEFVAGLEIEKFFGIGRVTAEKMHRMGIRTGADLRKLSEPQLLAFFGKAGHSYFNYARGVDHREVEPNRLRKSVGAETTLLEDVGDIESLSAVMAEVREDVWRRISKRSFYGRTVTLKIKYEDFQTITRARTFPFKIEDFHTFTQASEELLAGIDLTQKRVRLLGLTMSNADMDGEPYQLRFKFDGD